MDAHQLRGLLEERCSASYGPFVILRWSAHQWGVLPSALLAQATVCQQLLVAPPEQCRAWLLRPKTATEPIVPTRAAALLRVAALLKESVRTHPSQAAWLLAARREALAELWSLIGAAEPALRHRPMSSSRTDVIR